MNEMVFPRNPRFTFHNLCSLEAGGKSTIDKVKAFITGHSKEAKYNNQSQLIS
jgi:hypothetical protein